MALLATESPREEVVTHGKTHYVATGPRSLPQGAPTSPSITNALCLRLDARLSGLAKKLDCRYTRYADDMTFSWHGDSKSDIGNLLHAVSAIVKSEGFVIHPSKTRVMRSGARQSVTGLIVNKSEGRPPARVPRKRIRDLESAIYNREKGRPGKGDETLEQLKGLAAFVMMTDREKGKALMDRIDKLIAARKTTT